ncbi:chalcone--flavonone isomerase [Phoenix dactylifera]|uniref:Chalcone-flavonone isomerase family protein n=1 Tax=Phoenix dactylifera TaxID=42345 RepID=A0A8B9AY92_PHODC|nr:chalcone--flavonone isomerase [Phoenix dactylifera]
MGEGAVALPKLEVEGFVFPPVVRPPGSSKTLFLGGAGVRGLEIGGRFITFTAIGVYLEDEAIRSLSGKWRGKTADELAASVDFFRDIVAGSFEKFTRVTMVLPLTGQQYSEKVSENCVAAWKAAGIYTEAEGMAIEKFKEAFKAETYGPGSSILFTHSPSGALTIASSEDGSMPEAGRVVIENKALCGAILESIIGEHGVSPAAKRSLAVRLSELLKESQDGEEKVGNPVPVRA